MLSREERHFFHRMAQRIKRWISSIYEFLLLSIRSAEVAIRLSPLCILTPAAVVSSKLWDNENVSDLAWWYTLHALQGLGPAFVKLAQWAATRRDLFPPNICNRLSKLHDRGYTHSWSHSQETLTQAFGDYRKKGLNIHENDIIGAGSAGQVYSGTLTTTSSNGEEATRSVAIKILHPRFQHYVNRDLTFFKSIADLLNALPIEKLRMLNLPRVVDNFGVILKRQADLRVEADNLTQFRDNFNNNDKQRQSGYIGMISFPRPVHGWIDENVLVEELVMDAQPIAEYLQDSSEAGWAMRKELAGPLLRAFLKMVFIDNFCHCDLHPGNVLIQTKQVPAPWWSTSKETQTKRTLVFLDAGIATSLSPEDRRNLKDLFRAVILNNGNEAGRLMVERAKYERCTQVEGGVDAFANGVEEIVSEFHDRRKQGLTLGAVRIGGLLSRVLDLCREHGVEIDPAMANVVISTLVLEGLGRSLHPDLNIIDCAVPFVLDSARTIKH
jgi:aarF domain-containing kinase